MTDNQPERSTGKLSEPMPAQSLEDFKAVTRADVYKNDALAAHLTRAGTNVEFRYTASWMKNAGPPVATTLPVTDTPVATAGGAVSAFFAGLLPEGRRLAALRQGVKTSADDELSLLLGVGGDTIGDVRVVPRVRTIDYRHLDADLSERGSASGQDRMCHPCHALGAVESPFESAQLCLNGAPATEVPGA